MAVGWMESTVTQSTNEGKEDWAEVLIREYEEGADDIEVMAALNMSRTDFQNFYESSDVFKELVDIGRMKSSAYLRKIARKNMFNKAMNVPLWIFVMKNREGWAEKSEVVSEVPSGQRSLDEMRTEIMAQIPEIVKKLGSDKKLSDLIELPEKKRAET
jgi:hypothetical protein